MPKATVRHGLISYLTTDKNTDREYEARAFRGMTVDLSRAEYDRLLKEKAIVPAGQELDQPGRMSALPISASNEEILNWAMAATESDIRALVVDRPELADRLRDAHEEAKRRVELYNEHLGGVIETAEEAADELARTAQESAEEDLIGGGGGPAIPGTPGDPGTLPPPPAPDATATGEDAIFDRLVQGSNRDVENYLGEHPEHAQQILAAETRRADTARAAGDNDARIRSGVVKAVEVAAQHAQ